MHSQWEKLRCCKIEELSPSGMYVRISGYFIGTDEWFDVGSIRLIEVLDPEHSKELPFRKDPYYGDPPDSCSGGGSA
jgi:hypothetical protein